MTGTASVVVPVLDDAAALGLLLRDLREDPALQIVVVDGGSRDHSLAVAEAKADVALTAPPSRGGQLRRGVECAHGEWLWLLHADSRVPAATLAGFRALRQRWRATVGRTPDRGGWGWFRVHLDGSQWPLRLIEWAMAHRAACTSIATGDQGIFVHRRLLAAAGGVPAQPLMEDVELSRRLRRLARPRPVALPIATSARRWQRQGIVRTVASMWWLRLRYFAGADPERLRRRYYRGRPAA